MPMLMYGFVLTLNEEIVWPGNQLIQCIAVTFCRGRQKIWLVVAKLVMLPPFVCFSHVCNNNSISSKGSLNTRTTHLLVWVNCTWRHIILDWKCMMKGYRRDGCHGSSRRTWKLRVVVVRVVHWKNSLVMGPYRMMLGLHVYRIPACAHTKQYMIKMK